MTVEELHDVLAERLDSMEKSRDERHQAVMQRLSAINGRVSGAEKDITNLRVRDAYWAGGAAAAILLIKLLWG